MNSLLCIRPHKIGSVWVFSDEERDVINEPFVSSFNTIIDDLLERVNLVKHEPFTAIFSSTEFPLYQLHLRHLREDCGGNWYEDLATGKQGWLCPVLCRYFVEPPANIYARAEK